MRNITWLRYGLVSTLVASAGLGATLAACGDDDSGGGSTPDSGGGTTEGGTIPDSSITDAPVDSARDAGTFAKLTIVNATTDMGTNAEIVAGNAAIRVCFKQGATTQTLITAPYPPLPDKKPESSPLLPAGIYYGTGGTLPSFPLDLETRIVQPIIMNAKSLAAKGIVNPGTGATGTTCDELIGPNVDASTFGLVENADYWILPEIKAGTFKKERSYVLTLTGCVGDPSPSTQSSANKCGPKNPTAPFNPGPGNLAVGIFEVERTAVTPTGVGIQFLHASAAAAATLDAFPGLGAAKPGFLTNPADAGGFIGVTPDGGQPYPGIVTPPRAIDGVTQASYFAYAKTNPFASPQPIAPYPLPIIERLSYPGDGAAPPPYVKNGANFVFVAVGDPQASPYVDLSGDASTQEAGVFNSRVLHFLAFPTDPAVVPYSAK
jgi:hypothetical protein